ncbi:hypothetical protein J2853_008477 [Streptosporangium lutulentum]|uniref:Uncharacterized protein n=1 Tax=Streptosporangium lutulentum TaxID=1461250 RepID=A0ABT9QR89_9ACTN|nr:hypothetical protein [Streptosporangium lutulentum]
MTPAGERRSLGVESGKRSRSLAVATAAIGAILALLCQTPASAVAFIENSVLRLPGVRVGKNYPAATCHAICPLENLRPYFKGAKSKNMKSRDMKVAGIKTKNRDRDWDGGRDGDCRCPRRHCRRPPGPPARRDHKGRRDRPISRAVLRSGRSRWFSWRSGLGRRGGCHRRHRSGGSGGSGGPGWAPGTAVRRRLGVPAPRRDHHIRANRRNAVPSRPADDSCLARHVRDTQLSRGHGRRRLDGVLPYLHITVQKEGGDIAHSRCLLGLPRPVLEGFFAPGAPLGPPAYPANCTSFVNATPPLQVLVRA